MQWLEAAKLRISREFAASLVGSEVGSSSKKKGKSKKHPASAAAQGKEISSRMGRGFGAKRKTHGKTEEGKMTLTELSEAESELKPPLPPH